MVPYTDIQTLMIVGLAFTIGGILKGATGVGAPLVAVPMMTSFFDVKFAVAVFVLPNLISNLLQGFMYFHALKHKIFLLIICLAAGVGALLGSLTLQQTSSGVLEKLMAIIVLFYIGFKFLKPDWNLSMKIAQKLSFPVGFIAGFLQGAFGISSPATFTFLNAIRFERPEFIAIVSTFFVSMSVVQLPTLTYLGLMKIEYLVIGTLAVFPLMLGMPLGALLLRNASVTLFDRVILFVLFAVAVRLLLT